MSDPYLIIEGGAIEGLREIPDASVQTVVTSPPYWGLRAYHGEDGMIGLEPTLEEHLANLVDVFDEVKRVLRPDGTVFLNYGDAYAQGARRDRQGIGSALNAPAGTHMTGVQVRSGLAPKQRLLMPARVALALQDAGWWIRSEIVWAKGLSFCPTYAGSCMPSSVRDRPTDSHEMVYLLTKKPRYFYDADAVREAATHGEMFHGAYVETAKMPAQRNGRDDEANTTGTRNLRTVWTINPQGYKGAHFATFPEALVRPCVLAGTSERGACSECGAPWRRVVERGESDYARIQREHGVDWTEMQSVAKGQGKALKNGVESVGGTRLANGTVPSLKGAHRATTGWAPTCEHADAPTVPCKVLDPFSGSGTTGVVAIRHGRDYVGCEISEEYCDMQEARLEGEIWALDLAKRLTYGGRRFSLDGEVTTLKALNSLAKKHGVSGRRLKMVTDAVRAPEAEADA